MGDERSQVQRSPANRVGRVAGAIIILAMMALGPLLLFGNRLPIYWSVVGDGVYAPGTWLTVKYTRSPGESVFPGTWVPERSSQTVQSADGTEYHFGPESRILIRPDHTFEVTRMGKYDGNGRLLCVISDRGSWQVYDDQDRTAISLSITEDASPRPLVEHLAFHPRTFDEWAALVNATTGDNPLHNLAVQESNEQVCDASLPMMGYFTFFLARRGSTYALYEQAGVPYAENTPKTLLLTRLPPSR